MDDDPQVVGLDGDGPDLVPPLPGFTEIPSELTLSNGIKLKAVAFPRSVLRMAISAIKDPEVPVVDFGDGDTEENPNDPEYQKAWETVHEERLQAAAKVTFSYGLDVVELPEGMYPPEHDGWIKDLEFASGVPLDPALIDTPFKRKYQWLELYAVPNDDEKSLVFLVAQQSTGVLELEVIRAMRFFQDLGARRARERRAAAESAEGDQGSGDPVRKRDPVARKRVRGTRRRKGQ